MAMVVVVVEAMPGTAVVQGMVDVDAEAAEGKRGQEAVEVAGLEAEEAGEFQAGMVVGDSARGKAMAEMVEEAMESAREAAREAELPGGAVETVVEAKALV
ncbi:hypothetical protein AB1Y20_017879 [Prymnesium parvum]|uniref:Uncharacterized protein n=1 Tax=Prymnesium parvum TaxID=97485 RepID=A0AB34JLT9_PRYPA